MCENNKGTWKDISNVNFNNNIYIYNDSLDNYFESTSEKINNDDVLTIKSNHKITINKRTKNYNCEKITSIIDNNNYIYTLVSNKPNDWYCASFKEWDECSKQNCIKNCENNTDYSNCELLCEPVDLNSSDLEVRASTTDFGFGAATSCMCDGQSIMNALTNYSSNEPYYTTNSDGKKEYWVGVASPSWIQSPFDVNTYSGIATGGSTISYEYGQEYTSNCSIGNGGCGSCWQLKRTDGTPSEQQQKINAVVIDTCEDKNAYGNNYNWCVAQRPDVKNFIPNPGGTYAGHWPSFYSELPLTSTNTIQDGHMIWKSENDSCYDKKGNFICKNMDFHPTHFDVATQQVPEDLVDKIGIWHESTNPKVIAKRIKCPKELKEDILTKHCGSNSGSQATTSEYCKGHGNKMCYTSDNLDGLWPSNDCQ